MADAQQMTPIFWDRLHPGFSDQLAAAAQKHRAIEDCLQQPGNLDSLVQQHSNTGSDDPCKIAPFKFVGAARGVYDIESLGQNARVGKDEDTAMARSALDNIDQSAADLQALGLQEVASHLESVKERVGSNVQKVSESLEELVSSDPQKRKGRDEVLRAANNGGQSVEGLQDEVKKKMLLEVRSDRISKRMQTTIDETQDLCVGTWSDKFTESARIRQTILDEYSCVECLSQRANTATGTMDTVASIIQEMGSAIETGEQQIASCKTRKKTVASELNKKRAALTAILEQLFPANLEYTDIHTEHEALREKIAELEQIVADAKLLKVTAENASLAAVDACEQRRQNAVDSQKQVEDRIEVEAATCQSSMMEPARVAAFNLQLAKQLLANVSRDSDAELASLQQDMAEKEVTKQKLEAQMVAEEPEDDIDEVHSNHSKLIDEQKSLQARLANSASVQEQLQSRKELADNNWVVLTQFVGGESVGEQVRPEAQKLADDLYKNFKLWQKGVKPRPVVEIVGSRAVEASPRSAAGYAPGAGAGALVTIDENMKAWIEKMIEDKAEEKAQQKFEQFRADQLFRGVTQSSAPSSDAGDWIPVAVNP